MQQYQRSRKMESDQRIKHQLDLEYGSLMTFVWAFDHGNRNQIAMGDGGLNGQAGNVNSQRRSFFQEAWLCRKRERKTEERS